MKKIAMKALVAAGVLAVSAVAVVAVTNVNHDADRAQLLQMKQAYEQALNTDNLSLFAPHVDANLSATLASGAQIGSMAELSAHWAQLKTLIGHGKGGRYSVSVKPVPLGTMFVSDVAVSFGTTEEKLVLAREPNKTYAFSSSWVAVSKKQGSDWKLAGLHTSMVNPQNVFRPDQLQAVAQLVAQLKTGQAAPSRP